VNWAKPVTAEDVARPFMPLAHPRSNPQFNATRIFVHPTILAVISQLLRTHTAIWFFVEVLVATSFPATQGTTIVLA